MTNPPPSSRSGPARPVLAALLAFASLVVVSLLVIAGLVYAGRALQQ